MVTWRQFRMHYDFSLPSDVRQIIVEDFRREGYGPLATAAALGLGRLRMETLLRLQLKVHDFRLWLRYRHIADPDAAHWLYHRGP